MGDPTRIQPGLDLVKDRLAYRKGDVMHRTRFGRGAGGIHLACIVGEDRDEATVTGIEIEMGLAWTIEIWLLENEGHRQQAFPEVDRCLTICSNERDVMHALCRQFFALCRASHILRLVSFNPWIGFGMGRQTSASAGPQRKSAIPHRADRLNLSRSRFALDFRALGAFARYHRHLRRKISAISQILFLYWAAR